MLWTDGPFITAAELAELDNEIPDIAGPQNIDVTKTIAHQIHDTGAWLMARMQRFSNNYDPVLGWHMAQYASSFTESENRPSISLSQVVVTDAAMPAAWTELKRMVVFECLYAFYRDASRRKDTDRYEEKRDLYRKEIKQKYRPRLLRVGLPVISKPMPRPGAEWEPGSGRWTQATALSAVAGGTVLENTAFDLAITWLDSTQLSNNESAPSATLSLTLAAGKQVQVDISRLVPPTGATKPAQQPRVLVQTMKATHWNIYAAPTGETLTKQNTDPIAIGTTTYTFDPNGNTTGAEAGVGQWAERYLTIPSLRLVG